MGPRLASLPLLLLALCRLSPSAAYSWTSVNTQSTMSKMVVQSSAVASSPSVPAAVKTAQSDPAKGASMMKVMPNTIMLLGFTMMGKEVAEKMPLHLQKAFGNGVLCENKDVKPEDVSKALYGSDTVPPEERTKEENDKSINLNCANRKNGEIKVLEECFCGNKTYPMMYCLMQWLASLLATKITRGTCREPALTALKGAGFRELGKVYDIDAFAKQEAALNGGDINTVTENEKKEAAMLFCDAIDHGDKVRALYTADGLYWLMESVLYTLIFGDPKEDLSSTCATARLKTKYGECVCKLDTGFSFCIYHEIGKYFKEQGYLECSTPSFVTGKKPAALPQLLGPKDTSAATSLLLLPLATAAALLLRH